jgi:hypothetical protein
MMSWPFFRTSCIAGASAAACRAPVVATGAILLVIVRLVALLLIIVVVDGLVVDEIGRMEEGAFLRPDIDEGGLDSREDGINPSDEDVTNQSLDVWPVDEQLNQLIVFENSDSCFSIRCADEDFAFHREPPPGLIHATRGRARGWAVEEAVRAWSSG